MIRATAVSLAFILAGAASAHAPPVGPHGGAQTNAGPYHVEVVTRDRDVIVWVTDHGGAIPQGADRLSGEAHLAVEEGASAIVPLRTVTPGMLTGKSERGLSRTPAGHVEIRTPAGAVMRAVFR